MTKRKFQLYLSDCEVVAKTLTEKQIGRLFKAMVAYLKGEPTDKLLDTPQVQVAFGMIRCRLDEDKARQDRNAQRYRENGAKGGRPRKATTAVAVQGKTGEAHAETHPIEKATAEQSNPDGQEAGETKKTKAVLKKPKRLFENQSGFTSLQEVENQANEKTKAVFNKKRPETGSVEDGEAIPPHTPLYNTQDNNNSLSPCVRTCEGDEAIEAINRLEEEMLGSQLWIETICKNRRLTAKEVTTYIMDFCAWLREVGQTETLTDARKHFVNQLPHIIRKYQQTDQNGNRTTNSTRTRRQDERRSRAEGYAAAIANLAAEESGTA